MLALLLGLCTLFAPQVDGEARQEGGSLEALRARLEAQLAAEVAAVQPRVDAVLLELVAARREGSPRRAAEKRLELHDLPPVAAIVLVEFLGIPDAEEASTWRALEAGYALRYVASAAIIDRLEHFARNANPLTRRLAVSALGANPNRAGAGAVLEELLAASKGDDRAEIVSAIVRLGGERAVALLLEAVDRADGASVAAGLAVAAETRDTTLAPALVRALLDRELGKLVWSGALDYMIAAPEVATPESAQQLLALALAGVLRGDEGAELVERVSALGVARRHVQDSLDALSRSGDVRVATAALVALSRMGDRNAQKRLMDPIDAEVDAAQSGEPGPLRARGQMKIRLADYNGAINDLKKALKEAKDSGAFVQREINVDMARAYVLYDRFDKAASSLEDALLSNQRREELALSRDFRALAEHPRHGLVFDRQ